MSSSSKLAVIFIFFLICQSSLAIDLYYGNYDKDFIKDYVDVPVVAVTTDESTGILGHCRIGIIKEGDQGLIFDERTPLDDSAIKASLDAYTFAQGFAGKKFSYFISYDLNSKSVSGGSTGASIAAGMIALAMNKSYNQGYIISGAVSSAGDMLETGGLLTKIPAVSSSIPNMIIPQQKEFIYEKREVDGKEFVFTRELDLITYAETRGVNLIKTESLLKVLPLIINAKV